MSNFRHSCIQRLQHPKSCLPMTPQWLSLLDLCSQTHHVQLVAKMVPRNSRLTPQHILASLFRHLQKFQQQSAWLILQATPIPRSIILTALSQAGGWGQAQLSCMGCLWVKEQSESCYPVTVLNRQKIQVLNYLRAMAIISIIEATTNIQTWFFSPRPCTYPAQGRNW